MTMVQGNNPNTSRFDLGHIHRTSFDLGDLIPIGVVPMVPRSKFRASVNSFVRLMPTKKPMIDGLDLKINHFYVPYRVLWDGFKQFIAQADNGRVDTGLIPLVDLQQAEIGTAPNYPNGRLADYLGVRSPGGVGDSVNLSAFPFLAYQKIYIDHYAPKRWINYKNPDGTPHELHDLRAFLEGIQYGDGGLSVGTINSTSKLGKLRRVNWNHDYFTNALPTPSLFGDQKMPLFTNTNFDLNENWINGVFDLDLYADPIEGYLNFNESTLDGQNNKAKLATVRDLRVTLSLQHYLEKLQQGGGGYYETMKLTWNQNLQDDLLQRSEYLGGDVTTIFQNEVESNAATTDAALGDVAGKPIGGGQGDTHTVYGDEFGIYMAIAHVVPKRSYSDAMHRSWFDFEPTDFPNPDFENIGDQPLYKAELTGDYKNYANSIFGFVPKDSHYKTQLDRFSGEMRYTLKDWHFGTFASELDTFDTISPEFMEVDVRQDMFEVPSEPDKILGTFKINIDADIPLQHTADAGLGYI